MLAIPFRQQLPSVVTKSLDLLVPNIKKDVLSSITTRSLTDYIDWTDIPFTSNMVGTTTVGAVITPHAATLINYKYTVFARTMTLMLNTDFFDTSGNPTTLTLTMPGGFQINCNSPTSGDYFSCFAGIVLVQNLFGPFNPRVLPVTGRSFRSDSNGTVIYINPRLSGTDFGGPGDSVIYFHLSLILPLVEWRT